MYDAVDRDKLAIDKEEEERIRKRQAGTAVTIETFMAWKATFDEEQRLLLLRSGKVRASSVFFQQSSDNIGQPFPGGSERRKVDGETALFIE
jgi:hypothetical protein